MACLEHQCTLCGHQWSDNLLGGMCPECGSVNFATWFDEEGDQDESDNDFDDSAGSNGG